MYEDILGELEPERVLYIAIPQYAFDTFLAERFGQYFLRKRLHHAFVYDLTISAEWQAKDANQTDAERQAERESCERFGQRDRETEVPFLRVYEGANHGDDMT